MEAYDGKIRMLDDTHFRKRDVEFEKIYKNPRFKYTMSEFIQHSKNITPEKTK